MQESLLDVTKVHVTITDMKYGDGQMFSEVYVHPEHNFKINHAKFIGRVEKIAYKWLYTRSPSLTETWLGGKLTSENQHRVFYL